MKRLRFVIIGLVVLSILLLIAGAYLLLSRNDYRSGYQAEQQANKALYNNAGRMCAVMSMSEAAAELGSDVSVDAASFPVGFAKAIEQSDHYPLIDSCRYLGVKNNTRYINFVGQRYDNVDQAKSDFALQRQLLQETKTLDPKQYGADDLFYYGGAMFIRSGEVVFSMSINKPEVSGVQLESYTKDLFDDVYINALSLL